MRKGTSYPDCYKCGKPVEPRRDQAVIRFEGEEILFQRVPMGVCGGCGERFLTATAARLVERGMVLCRPVSDPTPGGVRALRGALGLSRENMATRLEVSAQTIFRWETGRSRPTRGAARRIEGLRRKATRDRRAG